ncbi:MAG: lysylphosphatidylglycerol synthase domain-containing protein [Acidimicrobiales bacterium]
MRRAAVLFLASVGVLYLVHHRHYVLSAATIAGAAPPRDWLLGLLASMVLAVSTGGVYRECLRTAGVDVPLARATRLSLVSHFFNCAVPGGKLSSIVLFTGEAERRTDAPGRGAAGFFTASAVGRVALTVVALVTMPFITRSGIAPVAVVLLVALYTTISVARVGVFALLHSRHERLARWELRTRARLRRGKAADRCDESSTWTACVAQQWDRRAQFLPALCWAFVGKLAGAVLVTVGIHAAGGSVSFATGLSMYAVATVAGSLALVPVGLGVVELTMMHSFTGSGLTIPQAAAALMIYRLFQLWIPMLAGAVGIIGLRRPAAIAVALPVVVITPELDATVLPIDLPVPIVAPARRFGWRLS